MAQSGVKGIFLRTNEKLTLGDANATAIKWDGTDLVVTTTGALKFDNCVGMTYAFKFDSVAGPVSAGAVTGAQSHKIRILVGAVPFDIPLNAVT